MKDTFDAVVADRLLDIFPFIIFGYCEARIVEKTWEYVKSKKHCIPEEMIDKVVIGTYLNIAEYVDDWPG